MHLRLNTTFKGVSNYGYINSADCYIVGSSHLVRVRPTSRMVVIMPQMKRTEYGYACVTEYQIKKKLDKELKKRRTKHHGTFNMQLKGIHIQDEIKR